MTETIRRITMQDGIARVEDVTLLGVAPASGILPAFATRLPTIMPILPEGTAAYKYDPNTKFGAIIVSRPPQIVNLSIENSGEDYEWEPEDEEWSDYDNDGYKLFRVAMPWTHFLWTFTSSKDDPTEDGTVFTFGETYPYWSPAKLAGPSSGLAKLELPNVWTDGYICWGGVASDQGTFASRIDSRMNAYFTSPFNADLGLHRPYYSSFARWANATRDDEYCWTGWSFYPTRTVEQLLEPNAPVHVPQAQEGWSAPPERFTVARAREWARTVPPDARRRLLTGLSAAVAELDSAPAIEQPAEGPVPRFQILQHGDRDRVTDTTTGAILLGAYRALDTLERIRDQFNELAANGAPIPMNGTGILCNCIANDGYHNLPPRDYAEGYFTTAGHRRPGA